MGFEWELGSLVETSTFLNSVVVMVNYLCVVDYLRLSNAAGILFNWSCLTELDCNVVDLV